MGWKLLQYDERLLKWAREFPGDEKATQALRDRVEAGNLAAPSHKIGIMLLILGAFAILAVAGALDHNTAEVIISIGLGAVIAFGLWLEQRKAENGQTLCELELHARIQGPP